MHGIVFAELQKFVTKQMGDEAWSQLLQQAGFAGKLYLPVNEYPDSEIKALVVTASAIIKKPASEILEAFGEFITPSLVSMYGHLLAPSWSPLDIIENTEGTIHSVVRVQTPGARPPKLKARRVSPTELLLTYSSPRQLCFLAIGIGRGLARHFKENLTMRQTKCMHRGDPECEILFRKL